jgi:large conductance mechanosensitive channel
MQFVAAIFGQPDFSGLVFTVNDAEIRYGAFLTVLVNFLLLALVLFKAQGSQECPYCKEFVAIDATRCKFCTAEIEPGVADEDSPEIATQTRVAD